MEADILGVLLNREIRSLHLDAIEFGHAVASEGVGTTEVAAMIARPWPAGKQHRATRLRERRVRAPFSRIIAWVEQP